MISNSIPPHPPNPLPAWAGEGAQAIKPLPGYRILDFQNKKAAPEGSGFDLKLNGSALAATE
jgi:hypothetical protein